MLSWFSKGGHVPSSSSLPKFLLLSQLVLTIIIITGVYQRDSCSSVSQAPHHIASLSPALPNEKAESQSATSFLENWWPPKWTTAALSKITGGSGEEVLPLKEDKEGRIGVGQLFFPYGQPQCMPNFTKPMLQDATDRYLSCAQFAPFVIEDTHRVAMASISSGQRFEAYDRAVLSQMFHSVVHENTFHVLCEELSDGAWNKIGQSSIIQQVTFR